MIIESKATVFDILSEHPLVVHSLPLEKIFAFVIVCRHLKTRIHLNRHCDSQEAPHSLPLSIHEFLCSALEIDHELNKLAWAAFRDFVWTTENTDGQILLYVNMFFQYGTLHGTEIGRTLGKPVTHAATLFTRDIGPVPIWTTSLYCRNCCTRYHHNFFVHDKATKRTYYGGMPDIIQVTETLFFEHELCESHADMMVASWTSATNCARIYNAAASRLLRPHMEWRSSNTMDCDAVWNAFFLNALLTDHYNRGNILVLDHDARNQAERLRPALDARNLLMTGPGQHHWSHACNKCTWFKEEENGEKTAVRATVTDGVTLGHPCCAVHDCQERLQSQRDKFCLSHQSEKLVCVVTSCREEVERGHVTCKHPDHRRLEEYQNQQNGAMFQLKRRLERIKVSQTHDSLATDSILDTSSGVTDVNEGVGIDDLPLDRSGNALDEEITCDGKSATGNKKLRAQFGPTFYGSEAPNGVRLFWRALFPTPKSLPQFLFMDSNCKVLQHIHAQGDHEYFSQCWLPVDVFHFNKKHKDNDPFCSQWCNPVLWPDLVTPEGKWRFNSSAAEQTNAWFGGYQAIVREMRVERYNFFLDEMIRRRNEWMVKEHEMRGYEPHLIPREELLY
ncbi:hypothetical protein SCHPADRAFT_923232 [Schizopora paradoxa]|uniref:CxC6 like cysteine cluster associated with KDZ domain-containing protein n=1 Tax=Schizopora paradoxa TaxID=27342 RepID=A0A0H2R2U1_9AGAM|nr:hypothetical protein SCHPADRAFT_923232 [Schizopora paradoxa]